MSDLSNPIEGFTTIVNGFQMLAIAAKFSILDVSGILAKPLNVLTRLNPNFV